MNVLSRSVNCIWMMWLGDDDLFSPDCTLGNYYASKVISDLAYGRLFKTSKTGIGALLNYILSFKHKKNNRKVFFLALPKITMRCIYHHLVYSLPNLHIKLRSIRRFIEK